MPVIRDGRFVEDAWLRLDDMGEGPIEGDLMVSLARLEAEGEALAARPMRLGVEIDNDVDLARLEPWLDRLSLIAIAYPSFADGRGFSLARRLRERYGYRGVLRARGRLISDQHAFARACGFDEIEIDADLAERQPEPHWEAALGTVAYAYQRRFPGRASILEARRAARYAQAAE